MKKIILLSAIAAPMMMVGTAHAASSAQGQINFCASVPNTCMLRAVEDEDVGPSNPEGADVTGLIGSATLPYDWGTTIVNTTTAIAQTQTHRFEVAGFCNYANHAFGMKSNNGGMTLNTDPAVSGPFEKRIPYTASLIWGTNPVLNVTGTGPLSTKAASPDFGNAVSANPTNWDADLKVVTANGTNPLVAGTYSDVLVISLGANLS